MFCSNPDIVMITTIFSMIHVFDHRDNPI